MRGQVVPVEKKCLIPQKKAGRYQANAAIHNRFDIEVYGPNGDLKQKAVGFNMILDALWTRLSTSTAYFAAIAYGSGTGTLAASRTDLFTRVGAKTVGAYTADYSHFADGYVSYRRSIEIPAGEITGQILREVGISYDTSAGHLMTHALLQDMNGNTVAITVGELDVITIYATVYVRFSASGYEGGNVHMIRPCYLGDEMNYPDTGYSIYAMLAGCTISNWITMTNCISYLQPKVGSPDPASGTAGGSALSPTLKAGAVTYTPSTKTLLAKWSLAAGSAYRFGASEFNPDIGGGWKSAVIWWYYSSSVKKPVGIAIEFPNNAKQYCSITDEAVSTGDGATIDFPLDFGFVKNDGSMIVKLDGVTVPIDDYTVDYGKPTHNKIGMFLRHLEGKGVWEYGNTNNSSQFYEIVENPFYSTIGIVSMTVDRCKIECSNDLETWVQIHDSTSSGVSVSVPSDYQSYRYWRATEHKPSGSYTGRVTNVLAASGIGTYIHFDTAPANGAVITASYRTESICKDANHIVDIELALTLNEYTES